MCRHLAVGPTCCLHIGDIPSQVRMAGGETRIILVNILTNKHLHNHNPNKRRLVTLTCPEPKVTIIGRFVPRNSWMLYWWQNSKIRALHVPLIQFHTAHWRQGDASLEPLTLIQKLHFESIWTGSLCGASWSSWLYINWIICRNQCYISQWTWNLSSNLALNTMMSHTTIILRKTSGRSIIGIYYKRASFESLWKGSLFGATLPSDPQSYIRTSKSTKELVKMSRTSKSIIIDPRLMTPRAGKG